MMALLVRWSNDMKIRNKLFISFVLVVLVPVSIVGVFLTVKLREMALNDAITQASNNVERISKRTAQIINVSSDISYQLLSDSRLGAVVNTRYQTIYDVVLAYHNYPAFREYIRLYKEIGNIRFYFDNPTLLDNWEFFQPTKSIVKTAWYQKALKSKGLISWDYIEDERDHRKHLSLIRRIDFFNDRSNGVLVINVNDQYLNEAIGQEPFATMIVSDGGYVVASSKPGIVGKTLAELHFDQPIMTKEKGIFDAVVNGESSKVFIERLMPDGSLNGLRIISVLSVGDIVKNVNRISILSLSVIFISLFVALILIYGLSGLLSRRLLHLSKHISRVSAGNFDSPIKIDGKDEIGQLSRQYNSMLINIKQLMNEVEQSQKQKNSLELKQNEIKFKMMASQINPHFLFNALESIRMKAHLKGEKEIAEVVKLLGRMMRKNLDVANEKITLQSEIEMVRCYLEIQKFRYEERLGYELDVAPETLKIRIPPLIIQPLVENAVLHGLEGVESGGKVNVCAEIAGNKLKVCVADNGAGMSRQKIRGIYRSFAEDDRNSRIGLRNVHERLLLVYGEGHGLRIRSKPGVGTEIRFTIPIEEESGCIK
ncbi:MAG TPA: sensor histidine kinase [Bacilli bacterium]